MTQLEFRKQMQQWADVLASLGREGLKYSENPYDEERYTSILKIAAQIQATIDTRHVEEILRIYVEDLDASTPKVGASGAIFNAADELLLIQRADNDEWELPGGAANAGETPAQSVKREVHEETGLIVTPKKIIAVHDLRLCSTKTVYTHFYVLLFQCEVVNGMITLSNETKDIGYFSQGKLPSSLASYARRQADVAFAVHHKIDLSTQFD